LTNDSPKYSFPFQEDVIAACAQKCQLLSLDEPSNAESVVGTIANWVQSPFSSEKPRGRLLVVVGTYSIGKERIVSGIAKALGTKIYAPAGKRRICACLEDEEFMNLITDDPKEAQVHMTRYAVIMVKVNSQSGRNTSRHITSVFG
jgi:DNA cross-link repair 1A protein